MLFLDMRVLHVFLMYISASMRFPNVLSVECIYFSSTEYRGNYYLCIHQTFHSDCHMVNLSHKCLYSRDCSRAYFCSNSHSPCRPTASNVFVRVHDNYVDGFIQYLYSCIERKGHKIVISTVRLPDLIAMFLIMFAMRTARRPRNNLANIFQPVRGVVYICHSRTLIDLFLNQCDQFCTYQLLWDAFNIPDLHYRDSCGI